MTLGNMRELGVAKNLIASCLNDACRHVGLIDVSKFPHDTEVPSFARKVVCAKCGSRGNKIDVRPKSYANHDAALKEWIRGKTSRPNSSIERRSSSTAICPELNTRSTTPTPVSDWKTRRRSTTVSGLPAKSMRPMPNGVASASRPCSTSAVFLGLLAGGPATGPSSRKRM